MVTTEMETKAVKTDFEPRIVGILCNWCSYSGADLAGTSRVKYSPNVDIIRVMCSGRVDPCLFLKQDPLKQGSWAYKPCLR